MKIFNLNQILQVLPNLDLITEIEKGFRSYSEGDAVVPYVIKGVSLLHSCPV